MKVLIISHNPITTYQNMGKTFLSLFSSFKKEELCQLYIYPTIPDVKICNSYYRITDYDVIKSFFRFGKVNSKVILPDEIDENNHSFYESIEMETIYKKNKKNTFSVLFRDVMWLFSKWYNSSLIEWLYREKPSCIFLAPGESKFIYNIALKISKELKIKIYTYVCDDYYFGKSRNNIIDYLQRYLLKNKINTLVKKSESIITICDELCNEYYHEFGIQTFSICTGTNFDIKSIPQERTMMHGITYLGNLSCNRYNSIVEIGRCIDEINEEKGSDFKLFLYTSKISDQIQSAFSSIKSIKYMGYVTGKEFDLAMHDADILLHVEGFDAISIERVKYSVSTKIADSLGSGITLFAYGPKEVASINHLLRNKCAIVVTNKNELKDKIYEILFSQQNNAIINNALMTANKYHNSINNSLKLYSILNNKLENYDKK